MEYYLAIITFTFVAGITPGPNNIMILASGLNHGIVRSLPHYLGICIGFPLMAAAVGFGLGVLFVNYPAVHTAIKVLGVAYLLFLAWKIANSANTDTDTTIRKPLTFLQAAAFQWVNPKAWIVVISAFATFTTQPDVVRDIIVMLTVFTVISFITAGVWMNLGAALQMFLDNRRRRHWFNVAMAALLVLSVVPMITVDPSNL